jgi:predicted nucleic-acid-binding protein
VISFDTNMLIRLLVEDDREQARIVQEILLQAEEQGTKVMILSEVLVEIVWVLESVYSCSRNEIARYLDMILQKEVFLFSDFSKIKNVVNIFRERGDFCDLLIVAKSRQFNAEKLLSFDKKLQKMYPDFVVETFPVE